MPRLSFEKIRNGSRHRRGYDLDIPTMRAPFSRSRIQTGASAKAPRKVPDRRGGRTGAAEGPAAWRMPPTVARRARAETAVVAARPCIGAFVFVSPHLVRGRRRLGRQRDGTWTSPFCVVAAFEYVI